MLRYLVRAAPALLPHVRRRPVTLARFPEGVDGPAWYQANCKGRPDWVPVERIQGRRGAVFEYCLVDDVASLLWVANLGAIELHPFAWTVDRPREPTNILFDLDPGPPAGLADAHGSRCACARPWNVTG
jgi:bifunctional non-homologous end joining protein LigD